MAEELRKFIESDNVPTLSACLRLIHLYSVVVSIYGFDQFAGLEILKKLLKFDADDPASTQYTRVDDETAQTLLTFLKRKVVIKEKTTS